jgi:hypothetical protein
MRPAIYNNCTQLMDLSQGVGHGRANFTGLCTSWTHGELGELDVKRTGVSIAPSGGGEEAVEVLEEGEEGEVVVLCGARS